MSSGRGELIERGQTDCEGVVVVVRNVVSGRPGAYFNQTGRRHWAFSIGPRVGLGMHQPHGGRNSLGPGLDGQSKAPPNDKHPEDDNTAEDVVHGGGSAHMSLPAAKSQLAAQPAGNPDVRALIELGQVVNESSG